MSSEMYVAILSIDTDKEPDFEAGQKYLNEMSDCDVLDSCSSIFCCSEYYPYDEDDEDAEVQKAEAAKMRRKLQEALDWIRGDDPAFLICLTVGSKNVWISADRSWENPDRELDYIWVLDESGIAEAIGFDA